MLSPLAPYTLGAAAASCTAPSAQEYTAAYNSATYLPPGYCPQPPAPGLHSLQPYPASAPVYNYPPGCYPQSGLSSSYSHPSASYLPAGISVSSPLAPRPQGYSYGLSGPDTLKRKAFEMSESQEEGGADGDTARYRKFGNGHSKGNGFDAAKTVMTPPYGAGGDYSPPSGLAGDSASGEHSFPSQRMPMKIPATHATPQDTSGGR
uniref:Uncharacterized protein n=1 Tax=Knipowitschia caucasica TaxID=637954 RepID=A0AAV2M541_KNICA